MNTTLIAGGGSLGLEIAKILSLDERVLFSSRSASRKAIGKVNIIPIDADLTTMRGRNQVLRRLFNNPDPLHRCVITMGGPLYKGLALSEPAQINQSIKTNLLGPLLMMRGLLLFAQKMKIGIHLIVVTSTTFSKIRVANEIAYAAAKAGLAQATLNEVGEWIRVDPSAKVTHFIPGGMDTDFWNGIFGRSEVGKYLNPAVVARLLMQRANAFENSRMRFDEWMLERDPNGLPAPRAGRVLFPGIQYQPGINPVF